MDEIKTYTTYSQYKAELDNELQKAAESFVKIGYLLKVARDTNILEESGYKTVAEFAAAEYNLDKTQVSRFISINDKFSENGYSDHLLPEYKGFGYAKLTIMLQLPTAINEELTPNYTKADIQAIRDEVVAEAKVTDIERMIEGSNEGDPLISQIIFWLGKANPTLYMQIGERMTSESWTIEDVKELMAPNDEATYSVRIPGGRYMLMLSKEAARIVNVRTGEKEAAGWETIGQQWKAITGSEEKWERLYEESFPEKPVVAPVQQRKEPKVIKATEPKKEAKENLRQESAEKPEIKENKDVPKTDVQQSLGQRTLHDEEPSIPKPDPIPEPEHVAEEDVEVIEPDIPGQDTIENHEEWMPDDNQIRGYRAAVSNKLNKLQRLWSGDSEEKITLMLDTLEGLKWNLEKLKEESENE